MPTEFSVANSGSVTPKRFREGTHRSRTPAETLEQLQPLFGRFGITRVAVISGLDRLGIPVVVVTRPLSRSLSVTQGKGLSLIAAKVSGIMEAVEHWHAEDIQLPLRFGSEGSLAERCLRLPGLADEAKHGGDTSSLWVAGRSLVDGGPTWVPYEAVHLDFRWPTPLGRSWALASSNGLASGNTRLEAIGHGLLELIERHLTVRFFGLDPDAQEARRIDLDSIAGEHAPALIRRLLAAGAHPTVWDLSDASGVPCFLCELIDSEPDAFRGIPRARGFGAHTDKEVALIRAVTESVQSRITLISGARDDILELPPQRRRAEISAAHAELRGRLERRAVRHFGSIASHAFDTFDEETSWLVQRAREAGLGDAVFVDLSRPELPVSVVRVILPVARAPQPAYEQAPLQ